MSSFFYPLIGLLFSGVMLLVVFWFFKSRSIFQNQKRAAFEEKLIDRFTQSGYAFEIESIRRIVIGATFLCVSIGLLISPVLALLMSLAGAAAGWFLLEQRTKSLRMKSERVNDDVCFFLARNLRAGHSLEMAIVAAANEFPGSKVVAAIVRYLRAGPGLLGAIKKLSSSESIVLDSAEKTLCATISLAQEMGGNSARVFERIGDNFHQSYELGEDTSAALAQVRMSVYVIGILPVVMFAFSFMLGSDSAIFLFTNPIGWVCLIMGSALEVAGVFWMKKMVDNGVRIWNF